MDSILVPVIKEILDVVEKPVAVEEPVAVETVSDAPTDDVVEGKKAETTEGEPKYVDVENKKKQTNKKKSAK